MNTGPFTFGPGDIVGVLNSDRHYVVAAILPGSLVRIRDRVNRHEAQEVHVRMIVPAPPEKGKTAEAPKEAEAGTPHPDLSRIAEKDWEKARLRHAIIKPLLEAHRPPASVVEQRACEFGYTRSRLYAWMRAYRNGGETMATLLDGKPSTVKGTRLLDPRIEALLDQNHRNPLHDQTKKPHH